MKEKRKEEADREYHTQRIKEHDQNISLHTKEIARLKKNRANFRKQWGKSEDMEEAFDKIIKYNEKEMAISKKDKRRDIRKLRGF